MAAAPHNLVLDDGGIYVVNQSTQAQSGAEHDDFYVAVSDDDGGAPRAAKHGSCSTDPFQYLLVDEAPEGASSENNKTTCSSLSPVHVDMEHHLFTTGEMPKLRGMGNHIICARWYAFLGKEVHLNIQRAGFGEFVKMLGLGDADITLLHALGERWWDTTHTFHFEFVGEMTMTPTDFSAMTGLPVAGSQIWFDPDAHEKKENIRRLFGKEMLALLGKENGMTWTDLYEQYVNFPRSTRKEVDQLTRVFLLAVIGSVLCTAKSSNFNLQVMHCLDNIDAIGSFNWAGPALASMYKNMDALSRGGNTTGCIWKLWEVWARNYIIPLTRPASSEVQTWPRSLDWVEETPSSKEDKGHEKQNYRSILEDLNSTQVNFQPWFTVVDQLPPYVKNSMQQTQKRYLMYCPIGYCWYLGERVARQGMNCSVPRVPVDPPRTMVGDHHCFTDEELENGMRGYDASNFYADTEMSYFEFTQKYLKSWRDCTPIVQDALDEDIVVDISEIRIPPWTIEVVHVGGETRYETVSIPQNRQSLYLPLSGHVKAVSAATATTLLQMIAGLTSVACTQALSARDAWMENKLGSANERKQYVEHMKMMRADLEEARKEAHALRSEVDSGKAKAMQSTVTPARQLSTTGVANLSEVAKKIWGDEDMMQTGGACYNDDNDSAGTDCTSEGDDAWVSTAPATWRLEAPNIGSSDTKRPRNT